MGKAELRRNKSINLLSGSESSGTVRKDFLGCSSPCSRRDLHFFPGLLERLEELTGRGEVTTDFSGSLSGDDPFEGLDKVSFRFGKCIFFIRPIASAAVELTGTGFLR